MLRPIAFAVRSPGRVWDVSCLLTFSTSDFVALMSLSNLSKSSWDFSASLHSRSNFFLLCHIHARRSTCAHTHFRLVNVKHDSISQAVLITAQWGLQSAPCFPHHKLVSPSHDKQLQFIQGILYSRYKVLVNNQGSKGKGKGNEFFRSMSEHLCFILWQCNRGIPKALQHGHSGCEIQLLLAWTNCKAAKHNPVWLQHLLTAQHCTLQYVQCVCVCVSWSNKNLQCRNGKKATPVVWNMVINAQKYTRVIERVRGRPGPSWWAVCRLVTHTRKHSHTLSCLPLT